MSNQSEGEINENPSKKLKISNGKDDNNSHNNDENALRNNNSSIVVESSVNSSILTPSSSSSSSFSSNSNQLPQWSEIEDDDFNFFLEWATRNGCKFSHLKFVNFQKEGRGGLTTEDIPEDSEMSSVPMNMIISTKTVRASQAGIAALPLLEEANITAEDQQWSLWYVYLLHEKGRTHSSWLPEPVSPPSFWTPYFQILPESMITPISFSDKELDLLKGTNLPDATRKIKSKLKSIYDVLFPSLFERFPNLFHRSLFTYKHFLWAYQVFWSRALSVIIDGVQQAAMVPLGDMLNHSSMVSVSYFTDIQSDRFLLKTFSSIPKGQQAYNNFGPRSNEKLLLNYGFVLQNNFADCFFVKLGMSNQDPLFEAKSRLMSSHNLTFEHYLTKGPTPIDVSLLNALRITLMNETEIYFFGEEPAVHLPSSHIFVSPRNEWLMISTLQKLLTNKLAGFETSIESDREALTDPSSLSSAQFLSIVCRLGQKEIIQNALQNYIPKLSAEFEASLVSSPLFKEFRGNSKPFPFKHCANTIAYEKWLRSNAIIHPSLTIAEFEGEKTFLITEPIKEGTDLITFPLSSLITLENVLNETNFGSKWSDHEEDLGEENILLLFLMEERNKHKSKWGSFFKCLPSIHSPLMFPDSDMCELDGTLLFEEVTQLRSELVEESQSLFENLNELGVFDPSIHNWNNYIWAKVLFESKVINGERNGLPFCAIPPLAFNPKFNNWASLGKKFVCDKEEVGVIQIKNQISYPSNSELMEGTNGQANHQLFLDHGVVLDGNRDDTLSIELNLGNDKMTVKREHILKRFGIKMEHFLKMGKLSPNLLAAVRVCVMNKSELEMVEQQKTSILEPISKRNEGQMIETLNNLLNGMLMGYSTTLEQDISILRKGSISKNQRLSVLYRKGQKQIILHSLKQLEGQHKIGKNSN